MSKTNRELKVAGVQMKCTFLEPKEEKVKRALTLTEEAAKDGARIILLPELFNMDYEPFCRRKDPTVFEYAEPVPGPTTNKIADITRRYGIYVIAPIFEKAGPGLYYNTAPVIGPTGVVGRYRKTHIPAIKSLEKLYFRAGSEFPVFRTEFANFGITICYDRRFPETWRILSLKGAEIIFHPSATEVLAKKIWGFVYRTRALDNGVFAVITNRVGKEGDLEFFGNSIIVNPYGKIIANAREKEDAILSAILNLDDVDGARLKSPWLRDFRPEIYQRLV